MKLYSEVRVYLLSNHTCHLTLVTYHINLNSFEKNLEVSKLLRNFAAQSY